MSFASLFPLWSLTLTPQHPWLLMGAQEDTTPSSSSQESSHSFGHSVSKSGFRIFLDSLSTLERKWRLFPFYKREREREKAGGQRKKEVERGRGRGREWWRRGSEFVKPGAAPCSNPTRSRMLAEKGSSWHLTATNSSMAVWICRKYLQSLYHGHKDHPWPPHLSVSEGGSHLMGCGICRDRLTRDIVPSKEEAPTSRHS